MVMISWAPTYLQSHQIVFVNCVHLFVSQSYFHSVLKKKEIDAEKSIHQKLKNIYI